MIKCIVILFLCLLSCDYCFSQPNNLKGRTTNNRLTKTENNFNGDRGGSTAGKYSVTVRKPDLKVLFATNENCDLYVNEELRGQLFKTEFLYLEIPPGKYSYKAVSKATHDEMKDTFRVKEEGNNEIFIDLLYVVDENNAQRESLKNKKVANTTPVVLNEKKSPDNQPGTIRNQIFFDKELVAINSLVANMVLIEGGKFTMGNNRAPAADETEHSVTIKPVFFSKYEVTRHQWETLMGYNPSGINKDCATCPVENVSWEDAMKFIRKLNVISNKKFRLPTEAEWEYVARIGGKMEVDTAGGQEKYINKTAWYFSNADKKAHPVGIKQPNVAGIYDLMGNVSEWCLDWYGAYYYKEDFNQLNPEGPPLGKEKVIRGGNFKDYQGDRFRPSFRNKKNPLEKSNEVGFRLVLDTGN